MSESNVLHQIAMHFSEAGMGRCLKSKHREFV